MKAAPLYVVGSFVGGWTAIAGGEDHAEEATWEEGGLEGKMKRVSRLPELRS
jgi:hypothetical protein